MLDTLINEPKNVAFPLLFSLLCRPKVILISGGHCIRNVGYEIKCLARIKSGFPLTIGVGVDKGKISGLD